MMVRSVGFTGTQRGMSQDQASELRRLLIELEATELHHGDCVGADRQADAVARALGITVVIHPPSDPKKRAFCAQKDDVVWEPLPYMERNRDIVESCNLLAAAPLGDREVVRSGTWSTVRYARRSGREVVILARTID